jgi:hypothetical protein
MPITPTKEWAEGMLGACEELYELYRGCPDQDEYILRRGPVDNCPLCIEVGRDKLSRRECSRCPWLVYEEEPCYDIRYGRHSIRKRQARIRRWIKRLKGIIEKG